MVSYRSQPEMFFLAPFLSCSFFDICFVKEKIMEDRLGQVLLGKPKTGNPTFRTYLLQDGTSYFRRMPDDI